MKSNEEEEELGDFFHLVSAFEKERMGERERESITTNLSFVVPPKKIRDAIKAEKNNALKRYYQYGLPLTKLLPRTCGNQLKVQVKSASLNMQVKYEQFLRTTKSDNYYITRKSITVKHDANSQQKWQYMHR